ncbi:hypothetical protein D9Q98_001984 [Chlorella vulgaris]|uniref:Uncharacterized protein n=1 Tax=Chlorella vulgaris TaxID=3077 RepID=A0A9D4TVE3_CHLVU|nr:hypothetical protein D9Q98_001984 [Chlorella vulgaris]
MQCLRRAAACRLLSQWPTSSSSTSVALQHAGFAKRSGESADSKLNKVLKMLEPREVEQVDISEEDYAEGMRRHKEFSRRKMQQHREWQTDLTAKLKLKNAAVAALPPRLRAAAEVPDDELFPLNREMWTETPPIEGFGQGTATMQQAGLKKLGTKHR